MRPSRAASDATDSPFGLERIFSFPPVCGSDAEVLILGSMPGAMSLRLQQYYGHPQNAFWKIAGAVLGFPTTLDYPARTDALVRAKVALWDVLAACVRPGSLDASIDSASIVPHDFAAFFARHPRIRRVCFNGATAEKVYRRHVLPALDGRGPNDLVRLPSTSPAHAGMPYLQKLAEWKAALS